MINQNDNPVPWALLVYELEEANEHLESLAQQMATDGKIEDEDFAVQLGHVYAHLNRIWHSRNNTAQISSDAEWEISSRFPTDLDPVG